MTVENIRHLHMHIPERVIGPGVMEQLAPLLARHHFGHALMLVCDDLTWIAAGEAVLAKLGQQYRITTYSLGHEPHAERAHSEALITAAQAMDGLIAVGSGTINDITKYAAAKLGKPYICVATAASMNGYTSANASLEVDGFKQSFAAKPPVGVLADISIILAAPQRMARSGLGDTLCRSTVEADMLLSHHLLGTSYPRAIFDRLRSHEPYLLEHADKLMARDGAYITALMQALLDGGDAMTEAGSSAVASQGEHMIVHTTELLYSRDVSRMRHGELVAVASLSMVEIQHQLLQTQPVAKNIGHLPSAFLRIFGQYNADGLMQSYQKKVLSAEGVKQLNAKLAYYWPDIARDIEAVMLPENTLERALLLAGVPTRPYDIKLDADRYKHAVTHAYMTRDRFTFLDLAAMAS